LWEKGARCLPSRNHAWEKKEQNKIKNNMEKVMTGTEGPVLGTQGAMRSQ